MLKNLLLITGIIILLGACASSSRNSNQHSLTATADTASVNLPVDSAAAVPLTNLSRTEEGGFVLAPGLYEAEFKTYCLQPGTPGPVPNDAYLQAPMSGFRKDIVETILLNSRTRTDIPQRNVQLLLWSVVSKSDFNKLSPAVRSDARELLYTKQIFELKGGVMGVVKTVSTALPGGIAKTTDDIRRLFEAGTSSYETFEQLAVLHQASVSRHELSNNQWYKQKGNYYVRHIPVSYQKIKIQVYVPADVLDADGKKSGEYLVFDPVGLQTVPVNTNAQRLGIGAPVVDIIREVIKINKPTVPVKKMPENKKEPKIISKT